MATTPGKNDCGVMGLTRPEFIVVKLDYSRKLVFPIDEGIKFIDAYGSAIHLKEEYQKPTTVGRPEEITVGFMSKMDLAALKLTEKLEG